MATAIVDTATGKLLVLEPLPKDAKGNVLLPEGVAAQVVTLTPAQEAAIQAAADAATAARDTEKTQSAQLRQAILDLAQTAVGVAVNDLTAAQRNALVVGLLHRAGALASDMKVRPLGEWMR